MQVRYLILLMVLFLEAALLVYVGKTDEEPADFSTVMEIWGDVLRDVDGFGLQLTRVSDGEEMLIGRKLAAFWREKEDDAWRLYVGAVLQTLVPHVRRKGIRYDIHLVDSPEVNAFALPGGQIFITTGMLGFLENEAELAAIVGHEIAHVDLRHCIEHLQYEAALKRVGIGEIGQLADIGHRLVSLGYNKYQEMEADAQGARMSIEAGYDPDAAAVVFRRMQARSGEATPAKPGTPVEELAQAVGGALGGYFRSHPPSAERKQRLEALVERNHRRLAGRSFYLGKKNYALRQARKQQHFSEEERLWSLSGAQAAAQRTVSRPDVRQVAPMAVLEPEMMRLPIGIAIGKYEVTQGQWRSVMGSNPSAFSSCGDDCPVEQVSWDTVQNFIQRLNAKTGKSYRLPTENEWFRACQAEGTTEYCGSNSIDNVAWYGGNSGNQTHPVGQKQPNAWGLYDMSGNVWEWTQDCDDRDCASRVTAGGSWGNRPDLVRAAHRFRITLTTRYDKLGFRLAQD